MRLAATILTLFLVTFPLTGQIVQRPLPNKLKQENTTRFATRQTNQVLATVDIPFWEDFSTSGPLPSANLWSNSDNVRISNGLGKNAPSINVAVFDGVDVNGAPYDANSLINGATDSLVSQLVDLASIPANQVDSVYLSFFWQINGNGEIPDLEDSLVLQFKDPMGQWQNVWSQLGGRDNESDEFTQELIQVTQNYFSDNFQFRFQSYSRLAGAFDTWLVDYIFLNDSRHATDIAYPDRALTRKPSYLTAPYSAMPTEQFFANPNRYLVETSAEFYNLNEFFQPIQFSTTVRETSGAVDIEILNNETIANPIPDAFERRIFTSPALNSNLLDVNADSLLLETTYLIRSGDNFLIEDINPGVDTTFNSSVDYRVNDTVRITTVINDYLAYDDGDPDFAAGINQRGGQLAYAFFAEERALLTHIDINFPFTQQAGEPVELFVWDELNTEPESILFQDSYSIIRPASIGNLRAYELDTPVFVQDTFYIGFQQATNEFLAVGLDKNNDTGDMLFFNVSGNWRPNESVSGSLLMRPRFDKEIAANFVPSSQAPAVAPNIYPNPSSGLVFIEGGNIASFRVYDSWGTESLYKVIEAESGVYIDLSKNKKGIYLLKFSKGGNVFTKRIILNN